MGQPRRDNAAFRVARLALVDRLDTERAWLANGRLRAPVRDYLRLALDCAYPVRGDLTRPVVPTAPLPAASPLLVYRAAICDVELAPAPPALSAVRAREPRFVETSFFLASLEIAHAAGDGPGQAKAHLAEVRARFPTSPAITFLTGSYGRLVGDWAEALRFYDQTLALRPAHDQALLGRTICLTNLARSQEAIGAATQLIGLGAGPDLDEAYYWRAWNRYTLARLDDARADIAAAKQLMITPNVLSLAGLIEHDQRDLDPAQADLEAAIAANDQDCTARWYLGLVHRERKHWLDAGHAFEGAMTCYRDRAQETADRIRVLQARAELDPDYRARQITSLEVSVASDTRQQHAAALTAANYDAAGGDLASAKPLAEIAGEDPTLADRVAKLRALLDKPRRSP
jgi:tetratricopeptide (TPR) repeat protein